MARRLLLGTRDDGVVGFWITKPGFNVSGSTPASDYLISTSDGINVGQILLFATFSIGAGGSQFFPFSLTLDYIPICILMASSDNFNAYSLPSNAGWAWATGGNFRIPYALVSTTGVTIVNPGLATANGTFFVVR